MSANTNILEGIRGLFRLELFPWDEYFATMAEADWKLGRRNTWAAKSFFMRKAPFGGSFALLGGLTAALRTIADLDFSQPEFIQGMLELGHDKRFVNWLAHHGKLCVEVWAPPEGTVFFPNEPVVTVKGPLPDIRLVEGILTKCLNPASLLLTKWF